MKKFRIQTFSTIRRTYEVMAKNEDDALDRLDRDHVTCVMIGEEDELEDIDSVSEVK